MRCWGTAFQAGAGEGGTLCSVRGLCPRFFPSVRRQSRSPSKWSLAGLWWKLTLLGNKAVSRFPRTAIILFWLDTKFSGPRTKILSGTLQNYFQGLKIYFQSLVIYFQGLIIYFQALKIIFKHVAQGFVPMRKGKCSNAKRKMSRGERRYWAFRITERNK